MVLRHSIALALGAFSLLTSVRPVYGATDPCSLLTPSQVSAVLGMTVGAGKNLVPTVCDWTGPDQPPGVTAKKVTVTLQKPQAFA